MISLGSLFIGFSKNDRENLGEEEKEFYKKLAKAYKDVYDGIINVSVAAIKQWERGERKPSGAALKLLNLVEKKGFLDSIFKCNFCIIHKQ